MDTPEGVKSVGCKWLFKKKIDMEDNVHIYKALLVTKGFTHKHSIDYDKTFLLVVMLESIRIMFVKAT